MTKANCSLAEIARALKEHQRFVVMSHLRPDGDALGCEIAMGLCLKLLGKDVTVWNQDGMLEKYSFLPQSGIVAKPPLVMGDNAKIIHIKPPIIVKELAAQMSLNPFRLINDLMEMNVFANISQSIQTETAIKLSAKYGFTFVEETPVAPVDFDVAIALDTAAQDRVGSCLPAVGKVKLWINIDHHISNNHYGDLAYIDPTAPATGQILYELIRGQDLPFDREIAENLFVAISTDTGSFQYP
ncbi:MAG TPA: translation initiation factor IF-2 N-terminal domain-containing protein, partial [Chthoniobacteraceae bacterium]|nr:translation initiation factor IF-2 N-terminal domain-containing protein [Chthoniobacteraceae bacterium]